MADGATMVDSRWTGPGVGANSCNTCTCDNGNLACTTQVCTTSPPSTTREQYQCNTPNVWSARKASWCCQHVGKGCPTPPPTPGPTPRPPTPAPPTPAPPTPAPPPLQPVGPVPRVLAPPPVGPVPR